MDKIIIIGAGGHAAEIDEYIRYTISKNGKSDMVITGFLDDNPESYKRYKFSAPYLGTIAEHRVSTDVKYLIGIANLQHRRIIIERFLSLGVQFASFVHPDTYISVSSNIGLGVIIAPNVNIGPNVEVGDFTLVNSRSSIGHDTIIGRFNFISPNVCFSGFTRVGDENLFGINSATIPEIIIGNRNKIAAGMIVDMNIGDDNVVFYRFKEKVLAIPKK